jgi:hypothetical protein
MGSPVDVYATTLGVYTGVNQVDNCLIYFELGPLCQLDSACHTKTFFKIGNYFLLHYTGICS